MVSVIHEPNRDPDARTVMGLLTPVNLPQPESQRTERREMPYKSIYRTDVWYRGNLKHVFPCAAFKALQF